jgi:hypothetical protein
MRKVVFDLDMTLEAHLHAHLNSVHRHFLPDRLNIYDQIAMYKALLTCKCAPDSVLVHSGVDPHTRNNTQIKSFIGLMDFVKVPKAGRITRQASRSMYTRILYHWAVHGIFKNRFLGTLCATSVWTV